MRTVLLFSEEVFNKDLLLFGEEAGLPFLMEVIFRGFVMFVVVLTSLRILGKRGVKQLSVFELVIILTLGSAGGDAIFYSKVGLLPAITTFVVIILLYRLVIYIAEKNTTFNKLVEGEPVCIIEEGRLCIRNFTKEPISQDELFAELRRHNVSHLGQLYKVYAETSGEVSLFYYPDEKIKYGLPLYPELLESRSRVIESDGTYSCFHCGHTQELIPAKEVVCPECHHHLWVRSSNEKRVT